MQCLRRYLLVTMALLGGCATPPAAMTESAVRDEVAAAERAFAASMAARDFEGFAAFVDDEAIFFSGPEPLRGKAAVLAWWSRYFEAGPAPFSWEPARVEVLASGILAHSSGPVRAPDGSVIAEFNSIWRRQAPGVWTVVFDKGSPVPD